MHKGWYLAVAGAAVLFLYGVIPCAQPMDNFGRVRPGPQKPGFQQQLLQQAGGPVCRVFLACSPPAGCAAGAGLLLQLGAGRVGRSRAHPTPRPAAPRQGSTHPPTQPNPPPPHPSTPLRACRSMPPTAASSSSSRTCGAGQWTACGPTPATGWGRPSPSPAGWLPSSGRGEEGSSPAARPQHTPAARPCCQDVEATPQGPPATGLCGQPLLTCFVWVPTRPLCYKCVATFQAPGEASARLELHPLSCTYPFATQVHFNRVAVQSLILWARWATSGLAAACADIISHHAQLPITVDIYCHPPCQVRRLCAVAQFQSC